MSSHLCQLIPDRSGVVAATLAQGGHPLRGCHQRCRQRATSCVPKPSDKRRRKPRPACCLQLNSCRGVGSRKAGRNHSCNTNPRHYSEMYNKVIYNMFSYLHTRCIRSCCCTTAWLNSFSWDIYPWHQHQHQQQQQRAFAMSTVGRYNRDCGKRIERPGPRHAMKKLNRWGLVKSNWYCIWYYIYINKFIYIYK